MVTSAKYQPGDLVLLITDPDHLPSMIVGVTEWVGGGVSYTVATGTERAELYAEELTVAMMDGRQMHADDFGPGECIQTREAPAGEDEHDDD